LVMQLTKSVSVLLFTTLLYLSNLHSDKIKVTFG
jgi:hypothetical protein